MPRKVYIAKYSGKVYNTREEAIKDNADFLRKPLNRFDYKSKNYPKYKDFEIPFIKSKRLKLTNAGLATGAIISENLLDTIAKYAEIEHLPIKMALGLVTKESTLGNPTDDKTLYKLISADKLNASGRGRTGQHINNTGASLNARKLVNYYKDTWNPYETAINYAEKRAQKLISEPDPMIRDIKGNIIGTRFYHDDPDYENYKKEKFAAQKKFNHVVDSLLQGGERYADKLAEKNKQTITGNVLQAAFRDFKNNPNGYNPGQSNYSQLVNKRGNEVWGSPEVQNWYRRRLSTNGKLSE